MKKIIVLTLAALLSKTAAAQAAIPALIIAVESDTEFSVRKAARDSLEKILKSQ